MNDYKFETRCRRFKPDAGAICFGVGFHDRESTVAPGADTRIDKCVVRAA